MKKLHLGLMFILTLSSIILPNAVQALSWDNNIGATLGLGTIDLQKAALNIIRWVLGLLGLIGVVMVMYGGFTWMTAGGNEDKIEKAKKVISAAVIGMVIVILSWAVVTFALGVLSNVTK
ncbi:MAG: hypothetical protein WC693_01425 [Patescibacteria group bacterium]|jgi:hypothetical protein